MVPTLKDLIAIALFGGFCLLVSPSYADCAEDNFDVWKVAKAMSQGLSKDDLTAHLNASKAELTAERIEKILKLIEEVYALKDQAQAEAWWKAHHKECPKEDEA